MFGARLGVGGGDGLKHGSTANPTYRHVDTSRYPA
jgi:hypothetical protein